MDERNQTLQPKGLEERTVKRTVQVALGKLAQAGDGGLGDLPGYELEQRLGAGGYGEVWRARTPDGLQKAIKIIYGMVDDARAMGERKSLERVKSVRHPFILSLERIEVLDGRLVVVTELADKSLRDRCNECSGRVPREELLSYLKDAAEALDYMFEEHSLQHLDIKPENLLLLGSHVKVADFGLTKNVGDGTMSEVAGLTPSFVAPEVLEGHPSQHSDQYSLAIVYQAMLTGQLPFRGRTTAQLISQHLHSPPDLSDLTPGDQSVLTRALAKNPARRFASCREFVQQLLQGNEPRKPAPARPKTSKKLTIGGKPRIHVRQLDASEAVLAPAGPVDLEHIERTTRPTFVLGIGGVARRVLQSFRRRLTGEFDAGEDLPVGLLYLDTDETAVSRALHDQGGGALRYADVLPIPLRSSAAYRPKFKSLADWMPRRWLFNIPRSGLTDGIRPLGRLAFVDHYREIRSRIGEALARLTADETIEQLQEFTALPADRDNPRVFVVAGIGGGTGSGAVLDAAFLMRNVLRERELNEGGLTGVLLQPARASASDSVLSTANVSVCLSELHHYSATEFYPGDPGAGIPTADYTAPFAATYLVPDAPDPELVAEYLFRSVTGEAGPMFDHLRSAAQDVNDNAMQVRSFAVAFDGQESGVSDQESGPPRSQLTTDNCQLSTDSPESGPLLPELTTVNCQLSTDSQQSGVGSQESGPPLPTTVKWQLSTDVPDTEPIAPEEVVPPPTDTVGQAFQPALSGRQECLPHEANGAVAFAVDWDAVAASPEYFGPPKSAFVLPPEPEPEPEPEPWLENLVEEARQRLPRTRGSCRLIIAAESPAEFDPGELAAVAALHGEQPTLVPDQRGPFVCCEIADAPLADFAALLHAEDDNVVAIADQLHSRSDVDW